MDLPTLPTYHDSKPIERAVRSMLQCSKFHFITPGETSGSRYGDVATATYEVVDLLAARMMDEMEETDRIKAIKCAMYLAGQYHLFDFIPDEIVNMLGIRPTNNDHEGSMDDRVYWKTCKIKNDPFNGLVTIFATNGYPCFCLHPLVTREIFDKYGPYCVIPGTYVDKEIIDDEDVVLASINSNVIRNVRCTLRNIPLVVEQAHNMKTNHIDLWLIFLANPYIIFFNQIYRVASVADIEMRILKLCLAIFPNKPLEDYLVKHGTLNVVITPDCGLLAHYRMSKLSNDEILYIAGISADFCQSRSIDIDKLIVRILTDPKAHLEKLRVINQSNLECLINETTFALGSCTVVNTSDMFMYDVNEYNPLDIIRYVDEGGRIFQFTRGEFATITGNGQNPYTKLAISSIFTDKMKLSTVAHKSLGTARTPEEALFKVIDPIDWDEEEKKMEDERCKEETDPVRRKRSIVDWADIVCKSYDKLMEKWTKHKLSSPSPSPSNSSRSISSNPSFQSWCHSNRLNNDIDVNYLSGSIEVERGKATLCLKFGDSDILYTDVITDNTLTLQHLLNCVTDDLTPVNSNCVVTAKVVSDISTTITLSYISICHTSFDTQSIVVKFNVNVIPVSFPPNGEMQGKIIVTSTAPNSINRSILTVNIVGNDVIYSQNISNDESPVNIANKLGKKFNAKLTYTRYAHDSVSSPLDLSTLTTDIKLFGITPAVVKFSLKANVTLPVQNERLEGQEGEIKFSKCGSEVEMFIKFDKSYRVFRDEFFQVRELPFGLKDWLRVHGDITLHGYENISPLLTLADLVGKTVKFTVKSSATHPLSSPSTTWMYASGRTTRYCEPQSNSIFTSNPTPRVIKGSVTIEDGSTRGYALIIINTEYGTHTHTSRDNFKMCNIDEMIAEEVAFGSGNRQVSKSNVATTKYNDPTSRITIRECVGETIKFFVELPDQSSIESNIVSSSSSSGQSQSIVDTPDRIATGKIIIPRYNARDVEIVLDGRMSKLTKLDLSTKVKNLRRKIAYELGINSSNITFREDEPIERRLSECYGMTIVFTVKM